MRRRKDRPTRSRKNIEVCELDRIFRGESEIYLCVVKLRARLEALFVLVSWRETRGIRSVLGGRTVIFSGFSRAGLM